MSRALPVLHLVGSPRRPEIDEYAIKFSVGAIALCLPWIELALTKGSITSISESFWSTEGPWPRNVFVGLLFSISTLLLAYNGRQQLEMWLGKLACLCAVGIAMFPCGCGDPTREIIRHVHLAAAGAMFTVLGVFCVIFLRRAKAKGHVHALRRVKIYAVCCLGMIITVALFVVYALSHREVVVLYGEALGLVSFGVSWLTASHVVPGITGRGEKTRLFVRTGSGPTPASRPGPAAGPTPAPAPAPLPGAGPAAAPGQVSTPGHAAGQPAMGASPGG
jgi:hypothetical protein